METRYAFRNTQLLDECQVAPASFEQVIPRLSTLMEPFGTIFHGQGDDQQAKISVCGLLSDVERQNIASLASRFGQARLPLQGFLGWHAWDDEPLRQALRSPVKTHWGQGDGVLVFNPSGFPQSGGASVGVARPQCGRLGTGDNCQVAIDLGYVSRKGHTWVDPRLDLPKAWTKDQARLHTAGGPNGYRGSRTRHQVAVEMVAKHGASLPPSWSAGDDEMGRPQWCRRRLATLGERYVLAGPSPPTSRALAVEPPEQSGRGRRPKRPWPRVEAGSQSLADETWLRIDVRDGSKGPLVVETVKRRVVSRTHRRQQGPEERRVVIRSRDRDNQQVVQVDDALSNAVPETPRWAVARVAKAAQRLAACLQSSTSAAGWADYEGCHGMGWQQPHTLSLLATWFLVRATERGKTMAPGADLTADAPGHGDDLARGVSVRHDGAHAQGVPEALATQCTGALLSL